MARPQCVMHPLFILSRGWSVVRKFPFWQCHGQNCVAPKIQSNVPKAEKHTLPNVVPCKLVLGWYTGQPLVSAMV